MPAMHPGECMRPNNTETSLQHRARTLINHTTELNIIQKCYNLLSMYTNCTLKYDLDSHHIRISRNIMRSLFEKLTKQIWLHWVPAQLLLWVVQKPSSQKSQTISVREMLEGLEGEP